METSQKHEAPTWSGGSSPQSLTVVGSTLYFTANDGTNGYELWKSDGTSSGTVMVKDIYSGSSGSNPDSLAAFGNTLYFSAYDATNGHELWTNRWVYTEITYSLAPMTFNGNART